jgi:DNA-binding transcriptional LysR family regulator
MFVRQLTYLVALEKEKHFARAAEICHVSQPALSSAIRHLEEELGVAIVRRGQRFEGFTPEGEKLLDWAQRILSDWESLRQEATLTCNYLTGILRIGAIPTTLSVSPLLTASCMSMHPGIKHHIVSLTAEQIIRGLDHFELDIGLTYLGDQRIQGFQVLPLYQERYVLLTQDMATFQGRKSVEWSEISELPLCLLTPNMQNRQIIDAAFRQAGVVPNLCVETDSIFALYSHVRYSGLSSVVPHSMLSLFDISHEIKTIQLTPELLRPIGLITHQREPLQPMLRVVWEIFSNLDLQQRFDSFISNSYQSIASND